MSGSARSFALLVLVAFAALGSKPVFAQINGDPSAEVEYGSEIKSDVGSGETMTSGNDEILSEKLPESEGASVTPLEHSGKLKAHLDDADDIGDEVELVEPEAPTARKVDTDAEVVPVPEVPETDPAPDRTRSGNLDAYYGK
jgi:hypothetical protein